MGLQLCFIQSPSYRELRFTGTLTNWNGFWIPLASHSYWGYIILYYQKFYYQSSRSLCWFRVSIFCNVLSSVVNIPYSSLFLWIWKANPMRKPLNSFESDTVQMETAYALKRLNCTPLAELPTWLFPCHISFFLTCNMKSYLPSF